MGTTVKKSYELENMIMLRLRRDHPQCGAIAGVVVTAAGDPGNWIARAAARDGAAIPDVCQSAKNAIEHELRRQFHLG